MDELSDYDFELPDSLLATEPCAVRDDARLLVVDRVRKTIQHHRIRDLPALLQSGDCLVLNDTRVVPARLHGIRTATGGRWEGLFVSATETGQWRLICETRGRLQPGELITVHPAARAANDHEIIGPDETLQLTLHDRDDRAVWTATADSPDTAFSVLQRFGTIPLPPYIGRKFATDDDFARYQTVYAQRDGAIAAPTAGLHFTPELLRTCETSGISRTHVTLHVGIGTFRPISVERLADHEMHSEWCDVPLAAVEHIRSTRERGGRVVAVGTTSVRSLESASTSGQLQPWQGETDLFIRPPYTFRSVDILLTNFHLPRSTLLVLVCTMAGRDLILRAYQEAIDNGYRFYSYGDAMLIL